MSKKSFDKLGKALAETRWKSERAELAAGFAAGVLCSAFGALVFSALWFPGWFGELLKWLDK